MTTFTGQISQSTDDGEQNSSGIVSLTGTLLPLSLGSWTALRFQNVTIPQGATINSATISGWATSAKNISSSIYANKVANAGAIPTTTNGISGLTRTTANVSWAQNSLTASAFNVSPDISAVIQEIVNQGGWSIGNALTIILGNSENVTLAASFEAYDGSPSEAAQLTIDYIGGPVITPAAAFFLRLISP